MEKKRKVFRMKYTPPLRVGVCAPPLPSGDEIWDSTPDLDADRYAYRAGGASLWHEWYSAHELSRTIVTGIT